MFKAMMIVAAVSAGAWAAGTQANRSQSCCAPGADCCLVADCCEPGADCCFPGSDCCTSAACCTSPVSTTLDEKPAAKEVKLTGTLVCGACKLNESKKCVNVLQVKEKDKTINYWLTDKGNDEPYHEKICGGGELKDVTVIGVIAEKDGKKTVKASKVDVK